MVWLPHWPQFHPELSPTLRLDRMLALLEVLGRPHERLPPVIHVAGTNGKGSTIAFMQAICEAASLCQGSGRQAGLKVHRYISPHLLRFNERIVLAGEEISDSDLFLLMEECRLASEQHDIAVSFFEGVTAAAFLAFSRVPADIVLLEVGLGGRLDATNVIECPAVTVITPISYDHEKILGDTIAKIAYEKACIMKPGVPCIVSLQTAEAMEVIEAKAREVGAPLIRFGKEFGVSIEETSRRLIYRSTQSDDMLSVPALPGLHQYVNAATAITAVKVFEEIQQQSKYPSPDSLRKLSSPTSPTRGEVIDWSLGPPPVLTSPLVGEVDAEGAQRSKAAGEGCGAASIPGEVAVFTPEVLAHGIASAHWPGRLTRITSGKLFNQLSAGTELWVDGAHNPSGAQVIADWLRGQSSRNYSKDQPSMPTCLIFNVTKNRDVNKLLRCFDGLVSKIICVNIYSEPLSYRSSVAAELIESPELRAIASHAETLEEVFAVLASSPVRYGRVLIAGSLYLASDFFKANGN